MTFWCLYSYLWADSTPFPSISFLNLGKCCRLVLPAAIKGQRREYYEPCKGRCKTQTTTWKENCINLKSMQSNALNKYLWNILRSSFHKTIFFVGNKFVLETSPVAISVHFLTDYLTYDALRDLKQFIKFKK